MKTIGRNNQKKLDSVSSMRTGGDSTRGGLKFRGEANENLAIVNYKKGCSTCKSLKSVDDERKVMK